MRGALPPVAEWGLARRCSCRAAAEGAPRPPIPLLSPGSFDSGTLAHQTGKPLERSLGGFLADRNRKLSLGCSVCHRPSQRPGQGPGSTVPFQSMWGRFGGKAERSGPRDVSVPLPLDAGAGRVFSDTRGAVLLNGPQARLLGGRTWGAGPPGSSRRPLCPLLTCGPQPRLCGCFPGRSSKSLSAVPPRSVVRDQGVRSSLG